MFKNERVPNIKRIDIHDGDWSFGAGEVKRRTAKALLRTYEGSSLCDASGPGQAGLWRWFVDEQRPALTPVHPSEAQFAYIHALMVLGIGEPKETLEKLRLTALFDRERKLWRWSDDGRDVQNFEARTQLRYVRLLCALGERAEAATFLDNLRNTQLYDSIKRGWPWFGRGEDSPPMPHYFASDQLAYIGAMVDVGERVPAGEHLEKLLSGPLFDGQRWVCCVDGNGQVIDPRRHASDQLDYVSVLARLQTTDAARKVLTELMASKLHDDGQWRAWIDPHGAMVTDERRTCDQFRYVRALVDLSDRTSERALERLKTDFWIGGSKEWRAFVDKRAGVISPCRLSADQLHYVGLLIAVAPDDTSSRDRELPIMRSI
jgi:hypothetical protein